jgi:hypothetical protein
MDAGDALKRGEVDAFSWWAPQAPVVDALLHTEASACSTSPRPTATCALSPPGRITLPRGAIDIRTDQPPATSSSGRHRQPGGEGRHPPGHRHPAAQARPGNPWRTGLLQGPTPSPPLDHALPLHPSAQRFYDSGPPFLQRYLPFWLAVLIDRLFVMLLPSSQW